MSGGIAAPTPKAIDSPAEPAVWTILFSRIVARRVPNARDRPRKIVIASTATGIDAETVIPTLRNRYSDDAPKTIPSTVPSSTAETVSSGISCSSGTYGRCRGASPGAWEGAGGLSPGDSVTGRVGTDM